MPSCVPGAPLTNNLLEINRLRCSRLFFPGKVFHFISSGGSSEWTQVIPNARLCKALLDRITDRAHIQETGTESYRFRRTAEKQKKGAKAS